ncbi:hypothetical protein [Brevibacillus choshinensis]|uniref:hypothetical protein n=1 Tax=Brevibacillus choshinensis TaxID=54911 RepID=UPI000AF54969|nr:hypothetical protein [Brevibacillus choshinensis]
MTITLRPTKETDISFVMELEHAPENSPYLLPWQPERHQEPLTATDIRHLIVEQQKQANPSDMSSSQGWPNHMIP